MKQKEYIKPSTEIMPTQLENEMLVSSPNYGVIDNSDLGDDFFGGDITYSKPFDNNLWSDNEKWGDDFWL